MKITLIFTIVTLASLPLYVLRCKDFSWCSSPIPLTLLEILILITFLSWLVWRLYTLKRGIISVQKLAQRLRSALFWPLVVFLALSTIAMFLSPNLPAAAGVWKAYFVEPALLSVVVLDISISRKSIFWIFPPLLFSGFWIASLAIWQWITEIDTFSPDYIVSKRVTAVFDNPNALGLYLGPLVLIGLGVLLKIFRGKSDTALKLVKLLLVVSFLVAYISAIYLSRSRGALIGLGVSALFFFGVIFYQTLSEKLKKISIRSLYTLIAVSAVLLILGFVNIDRVVPAAVPKVPDTAYTRLCIWQGTNKMLGDNVVTGAGLSGFPLTYPKYATCEKQAFQYPHNIFLNFWVEMGFFGLMVLLWISFIYSRILSKHNNDFLAVGLFGALVYIFIHGLVDVPYFKNDLSAAFWVFLAGVVWFEKVDMKETT